MEQAQGNPANVREAFIQSLVELRMTLNESHELGHLYLRKYLESKGAGLVDGEANMKVEELLAYCIEITIGGNTKVAVGELLRLLAVPEAGAHNLAAQAFLLTFRDIFFDNRDAIVNAAFSKDDSRRKEFESLKQDDPRVLAKVLMLFLALPDYILETIAEGILTTNLEHWDNLIKRAKGAPGAKKIDSGSPAQGEQSTGWPATTLAASSPASVASLMKNSTSSPISEEEISIAKRYLKNGTEKRTLGESYPEIAAYFSQEDLTNMRIVFMDKVIFDLLVQRVGYKVGLNLLSVDTRKATVSSLFNAEFRDIIDNLFDQSFVIVIPRTDEDIEFVRAALVHEIRHYFQGKEGQDLVYSVGLPLQEYLELPHEKDAHREQMRYLRSKGYSFEDALRILTGKGKIFMDWEEGYFRNIWQSISAASPLHPQQPSASASSPAETGNRAKKHPVDLVITKEALEASERGVRAPRIKEVTPMGITTTALNRLKEIIDKGERDKQEQIALLFGRNNRVTEIVTLDVLHANESEIVILASSRTRIIRDMHARGLDLLAIFHNHVIDEEFISGLEQNQIESKGYYIYPSWLDMNTEISASHSVRDTLESEFLVDFVSVIGSRIAGQYVFAMFDIKKLIPEKELPHIMIGSRSVPDPRKFEELGILNKYDLIIEGFDRGDLGSSPLIDKREGIPGGIDPSTSLRVNTSEGEPGGIDASTPLSIDSQTENPGGIDFRGLPIVTQPKAPVLGRVPLGTPPRDLTGTVPSTGLDKEWQAIQNMLQSGIIPSSERIKEYLEACCVKDSMDKEIDKVLACIADILRLEEERCQITEAGLKELLVLLESDKPVKDMQRALINITILPKEPAIKP